MSDSYGENIEAAHPDSAETVEEVEAAGHGFEPTGNPVVDGVLESLERLDGAPVSEHVAAFESAHEKLRAALADAGNDDRPS